MKRFHDESGDCKKLGDNKATSDYYQGVCWLGGAGCKHGYGRGHTTTAKAKAVVEANREGKRRGQDGANGAGSHNGLTTLLHGMIKHELRSRTNLLRKRRNVDTRIENSQFVS